MANASTANTAASRAAKPLLGDHWVVALSPASQDWIQQLDEPGLFRHAWPSARQQR